MPRLSSRRGGECPWKSALLLSLGCRIAAIILLRLAAEINHNVDHGSTTRASKI